MVWQNWARTASADPEVVERPGNDAEVAAVVRWAAARGKRVRAVGAGHSFTDCAATDGVLLSLDAINRVEHVGAAGADGSREVRVGAGIRLRRLCSELAARGLALENMGDIDRQSIAGAISTGTHGTGARLGGLATQVRALRLVTANGEIVETSPTRRPDLFELARLGLGVAGVLTAVTLRAVPAFELEAHEAPMPLGEVLESLLEPDGLVDSHDHVELYWWPHTDVAQTKVNDRRSSGAGPLHPVRRLIDDEVLSNGALALTTGLCSAVGALTPAVNNVAARALTERRYRAASHRVFTSPRRVRFREMEYALPRQAVVPVLEEIRSWLGRSGENVPFPIEVRFAAADDVWLSTAHRRETAYIAVHQTRWLPFARYFRAVEAMMAEHAGRPHWGKLHRLRADDLRALYPRFDDALTTRDAVDPGRVFGNTYTERVFGD
ncbi:D-arabinono-1,4-lactone oxidase [Pseudactinotalea suaedae]|uniref:D-arabinono-1,4-lactone oxidase n=1 Tax=Pseudactinotalea suaedae TaxID=1524924 RepID=UPI0012E261AB|nr:D-arabinono-1,4-lactone oxidase [Pseudactinotalea suaedae]